MPDRWRFLTLIRRFTGNARLLFAMIRDIAAGRYRKIPYWSAMVLLLGILYIFFPFDIIPDFIPGYGQIDDAAIALLCLYLMEKDLRDYEIWKNQE